MKTKQRQKREVPVPQLVPGLPQLLDRTQVARILGVTLRSFDREKAAGRFPQPDCRTGKRSPRWKAETVARWIDAQGKKG